MELKLNTAEVVPEKKADTIKIVAVVSRQGKLICRYQKGVMEKGQFVQTGNDRKIWEGAEASAIINSASGADGLEKACYEALAKELKGVIK